ncbi:MAG: SDR family NAD(P)-dependent oxidoreductase [Acidimicrobiia bacterium]
MAARRTPAELFDLSGRVALVTGGSRGLGRSMVFGFARAGADVIISSRKLDACEEVAEEVENETGRRAVAIACHVGHWDQLEQLASSAYDEFEKVDVLVNNVGMSPLYPSPLEVTEELYDKIFDVNLKGPFRLSALIGTRMVAGDGGSIINVSSMGAVRPDGGIIPYAAAKAGVNAMTAALAQAFGPKVRVNCIMPGSFMTDVTESWDLDAFALSAKRFALQRGGDPDEIIGTALYLASDASSYTTGTVIAVEGGMP